MLQIAVIAITIWIAGGFLICAWYGQSNGPRILSDEQRVGLIAMVIAWPLIAALLLVALPFWLMYELGRWMAP